MKGRKSERMSSKRDNRAKKEGLVGGTNHSPQGEIRTDAMLPSVFLDVVEGKDTFGEEVAWFAGA